MLYSLHIFTKVRPTAMEYILKDLEPKKCFHYFEEISRIPRSSYEEQQVSQYVMDFAAARGLKSYMDAAYNVYVSKPATPGFENRKPVIIQAHLDMVCVKDPGVKHDFTKDPIELIIDGEWVHANGTTLGADNGSGVAMMLALLDSDDIPHPAIQCLFTTAEEVGLVGASQLEADKFEGDYLINLDGGNISKLLTASAGTATHIYTIDEEQQPLCPDGKTAIVIAIDGLTSGHSGSVIHKGYANSIKLMGDILSEISAIADFRLCSFTGGVKMNAISKEARAIIACNSEDADKISNCIARVAGCLKKEFARTDPDLMIISAPDDVPATAMSPAAQTKLIAFIDLLFDGAYMYYNDEKTMAKTSCNIGILESIDGKTVATCLMRSNSNFEMDQLIRKSQRISALLGVEHIVKDRSSAWEGDGTPLILRVAEMYEAEFGAKPTFTQAHGGVEIGTILGLAAAAGKTIHAVNFGATSEAVHTTRERLHIPGMQQGYAWLQHVLANLD